jgi:hypothetical protein
MGMESAPSQTPCVPASVVTRSTRLVLNVASATMDRLQDLADQKGMRVPGVIREAIAIYSYIASAKAQNPHTRILIDRADGQPPAELVLPS